MVENQKVTIIAMLIVKFESIHCTNDTKELIVKINSLEQQITQMTINNDELKEL